MNQIKKPLPSDIKDRAGFSTMRYGQCWEDADILIQALDIKPGDTCLSIASAGDNALAMLTQSPGRVIALDIDPAQLYCLELRVAAYKTLEHHEFLKLVGSRPSEQRLQLYQQCRGVMSAAGKKYWDARAAMIDQGIGSIGKIEQSFRLFRKRIMPFIHSKKRVARLLAGGDKRKRQKFYNKQWNNWRWRLLFRMFFSKTMMARMMGDPKNSRYIKRSVATRLLARTKFVLTELDPKDNPYLQWILTGQHITALPYALRKQNFDMIRGNIDKIEWHLMSVEDYLASHREIVIDKCNLSDIFDDMTEENYVQLLDKLVRASGKGGRLAYWNRLAPRRRPPAMANRLRSLESLADDLFKQDKAFFYSAFILEEVV